MPKPVGCTAVLFLWLAIGLLLTTPARADGTVYRVEGCGKYIYASAQSGYSVLVVGTTQGVKQGDYLEGDVERIGHPTLFDRTLGQSLFAIVESRGLNASEISQRIAVSCRAPLGETLASGSVLRVCGNFIFVNTANGYTVLERLSGGIVADDDDLTGNFNRPGRATVRDRQSASLLTVYVQDLWLSKTAAQRKIQGTCSAR